MNKIVLALLFVLAGAATASAQSVQWRGVAFLDAITPACAADGWRVGSAIPARFNAPNVGGSGNVFGLGLHQTFGAMRYDVPGRTKVGETVSATGGTMFAAAALHPKNRVKLKIVTLSPAKIDADTPLVNYTVEITNFGNKTGCTATLRAVLAERP